MSKILVSYAYSEKSNTRENLFHFLKYGLRCNMHLMLHIKGANKLPKFEQSNISVLESENKGYDYDAHLRNMIFYKENIKKIGNFDYIILMNDSCCGPFYKYMDYDWFNDFKMYLRDKNMVGIINNQGWFNVFNMNVFDRIFHFLKSGQPLVTYKNAHTMEIGIREMFQRNKEHANLLNINSWACKHEPFESIFVKENRIGRNKGTGWPQISYITSKVFEDSKRIMRNVLP